MRLFFVVLLVATATAAQGSEPALQVTPTRIEIRQHRHPHSLLVYSIDSAGFSRDHRTQAQFRSDDPKIATVSAAGWVTPVANGQTTITVTVDRQSRTIPVTVALPSAAPPTSFRHEVMPVLTKAGCNMGACHGYSLGKNGFKLSLRGQEAEQDFPAIVREYAGRRLNFQFPEQSLLVAKARGDTVHEGGVRFTRGSLMNDILVNWISAGAPGDLKDTNEVVAVKLIPDQLVLKPGDQFQLQLLATYRDGTVRDVTRLGVFAANNSQFASVSEEGLVRANDVGETAIVGRFERLFSATSTTVLRGGSGFTPAPLPKHIVDKPVIEKLNRLKIQPSDRAADDVFLRRVYLDLIGVQPRPDEVTAFVADADPKKRERIVDKLFERPEFVDWWSLKWGDLLQNSRNHTSPASVFLFREFLRSSVSSNLPWDQFARKILTSHGGPSDDPAAVYFAISKDTNDTVERVAQVFTGVRMLCARCHAHPMENWTQADYYGLASFFNQVGTKPDPRTPTVPGSKLVLVNLKTGYANNPRTNTPQAPKFLGGQAPQLPEGGDRRNAFADWLVDAKNPFFARGITNRIWSYFFHRGIIDPVDDIRSTNPPINPDLLEALTADFVAHKFDIRHLMKTIITSETYQRSSVANETNLSDEQNFSRAIPRRVPAEALLDSLLQATGVAENISGAPAGFRAAQHPDGNTDNDFLKLFGKPQRMDACECERDNGSNMHQALNMINGKSILARVKNPAARPAVLARAKTTDEAVVTELYLWSLARKPSAKELKLGMDFLKEAGMDRADALQDLMWALLNSRDFLLSH